MADTAELEGRIRSLEARIERVEDIEAIRALKARYGELADLRYGPDGVKSQPEVDAIAAQISELFTEDAVWDGGASLGLCRGRAAIRDRLAKPTLLFSWHYFVKPQIRIEGATAEATWDVFAPCTRPDGRPYWMAGLERDAYAKQEGRWLHSRMQLDVVFFAPYERGWARPPTE